MTAHQITIVKRRRIIGKQARHYQVWCVANMLELPQLKHDKWAGLH